MKEHFDKTKRRTQPNPAQYTRTFKWSQLGHIQPNPAHEGTCEAICDRTGSDEEGIEEGTCEAICDRTGFDEEGTEEAEDLTSWW